MKEKNRVKWIRSLFFPALFMCGLPVCAQGGVNGIPNQTKHYENGFVFTYLSGSDKPGYVELEDEKNHNAISEGWVVTGVPNVEDVHVPTTLTYKGQEYAVLGIKSLCKDAVGGQISAVRHLYVERGIYYMSEYNSNAYGEWTEKLKGYNVPWSACSIHVPDARLYDAALCWNTDAGYGTGIPVFSEKRNYIPGAGNSYTVRYGEKTAYDVDGDGHIDMFINYNEPQNRSVIFLSPTAHKSIFSGRRKNSSFPRVEQVSSDHLMLMDVDEFTNLRTQKPYDITYSPINHSIYTALTADFDGDGRKEIITDISFKNPYITENYIKLLKLQADGTFKEERMSVTTDTGRIAQRVIADINSSTGGGWSNSTNGGSNGNVWSLGQGMFVKSRKPSAELLNSGSTRPRSFTPEQDSETFVADFNGDGLMDFYFQKSIYYNLGGNEFFKSNHDGRIYSADFNGDGMPDYLDFTQDKLLLYKTQADGSLSAPKSLFVNANLDHVFFGDFDKDGDVDVLLFVPDENANATYFVFLRNDGKGNFKKKENYIEGLYEIRQSCADYDGDGLYELYVTKKGDIGYTNAKLLIHIAADLSLSTTSLPTSNYLFLADFNHDGITEQVYAKKIYSTNESYIGEEVANAPLEGAVVNTRPEKMEPPVISYQANRNQIKITWQRGHDAQTSACDLTYELRIGSTPGGNDILCANALPDGTRRNLLEGDMGRNLQYVFSTNNLPEGTYYVAVQAIDAGRLGSEWSDEAVYEHKLSMPVIAPLGEGYATTDTINLRVLNPQAGATYEWDIPDARIIASHANGSEVNVCFKQAGEYPIKVIMRNANGQSVESNATSSYIMPFHSMARNESRPVIMLDMDQDGIAEVSQKNTNGDASFMKRNAQGMYEKMRMSFNSDFSAADYINYLPLDYNKDGFPDFYICGVDKGNLYVNMGEGDGDYDYEKKDTYVDYVSKYVIDLNNDGNFDMLENSRFGLIPSVNKGDNLHFSHEEYFSPYWDDGRIIGLYDVNRDGVPDLIWDDDMGKTKVFFKTPKADVSYTDPEIYCEGVLDGMADFNSDGLADGYYFENKQLVIVKGRPQSEWICKEKIHINVKDSRVKGIVDLDNNGYPDILLSNQAVMMYEGFRYKVVDQTYIDPVDEYHWQPLANGEYPNGIKSNVTNQAPLAPSSLTARQTEQGLFISWADASDAETPAAQMRYNVSVKRRNQLGEGAFLISPMNGLSDKATICSGLHYRRATQMLVPASVLTEGETYEIQVQSIDLMGEHSPMTAPVVVTINSNGYIEVEQTTHTLDAPTTVKYVGTKAQTFTLDATHTESIKDLGHGQYRINWAEAGLQTITLKADGKTYTTQVYVKPNVDMALCIGDGIYLEAPLQVKIPEAVRMLQAASLTFENTKEYSVEYIEGDSVATFVFHAPGSVEVGYSAVVNGERRTYTSEVWVYNNILPQPTIKFVSANGSNYMLFVNVPENGIVKAVEVSRQNPLTKQFEVIGVANNVGKISFLDTSGVNVQQAQSYSVRFVADNGIQRSESSAVHTPLHLAVNQCAKGINLLWNAYDGLAVDEYIIMRGTTPKNCQEIARVDGKTQSFIDANVTKADGYYYAVAFSPSTADDIVRQSWSNVVSASEAVATHTFANSLTLTTLENNAQISDEQISVHLMAVVLPTFADISKISWHIKSGADVARLLPTGELVFTNALGGEGTIIVEARTLDGSSLISQIAIPYHVSPDVTSIDHEVINDADGLHGSIRYYDLTGRWVKHLIKGHIYITSQGKKIVAE